MSKTKVTVVAIFATFILSMVGAASASALPMSWFVNGTALTSGSVALSNTAAVDTAMVLNDPKLNLQITCSALSGSKAEIQGSAAGESAMGQAKALNFENCSEISPPKCKLLNTTISTEPILVLILLVPDHPLPLIGLLFQPEEGNAFATLNFVKVEKGCAIEGEQPVDGKVLLHAPLGADEETLQPILVLDSEENDSLEIDGDPAYLEKGNVLLKLASSQTWSFHE